MDTERRKVSKEANEYFDKTGKQKAQRLILDHRISGSRHEYGDKKDTPRIDYSYKQLQDYIATLNPVQLAQQVQIIPRHAGSTPKAISLEPVIGAGTVEEMFHVDGEAVHKTHSSVDWQHHPEEVVLLTDGNGFGEDGDTSYLMKEIDGELHFVGNKSGKVRPIMKRKSGEPSIKSSRSKVFQANAMPDKKTPELMARLDELCVIEEIDDTLKAEIVALQAELYRRMFRLDPRKPRDGSDVTVHAPEDELGNNGERGFDDEEDDDDAD